MKRRKVTLLVAAMLAMLTMAVAPAFADDNLDCQNRPGPFIGCDGDRFVNVDRADDLFGDNNNNDGVDFVFVPVVDPFFLGFDEFGCGFDWDGPVTPLDCI